MPDPSPGKPFRLGAAGLFGFTLSYDEIPRTMFSLGGSNTLPLEILALTNTETSPALYAIGTLTTCVSLIVIPCIATDDRTLCSR